MLLARDTFPNFNSSLPLQPSSGTRDRQPKASEQSPAGSRRASDMDSEDCAKDVNRTAISRCGRGLCFCRHLVPYRLPAASQRRSMRLLVLTRLISADVPHLAAAV